MVFQKKNKRNNKLSFIFAKNPVEAASHYTYLGMTTSASGDFKTGIEVLSSKAKNPLSCSIAENIALQKLPIHIAR